MKSVLGYNLLRPEPNGKVLSDTCFADLIRRLFGFADNVLLPSRFGLVVGWAMAGKSFPSPPSALAGCVTMASLMVSGTGQNLWANSLTGAKY